MTKPEFIGREYLERQMQVAEDIKKAFAYDKSTGKWFWCDRDETNNLDAHHGPFDSFLDALEDAVAPYNVDEDEGKDDTVKERLEYLRGELRAERISTGELLELQSLVPYIEEGDVELLEAAGVPENEDEDRPIGE